MKQKFLILCFFLALLTIANAEGIYKCIDSNGDPVLTSIPQDGMKCSAWESDKESSSPNISSKNEESYEKPSVPKTSSKKNVRELVGELNEINNKIKEKTKCIGLFQEMRDLDNEKIALMKRRYELHEQEFEIMKECAINNSPNSVWQERTQYVRDKIKEVEIENSLLWDKMIKNERESKINNCGKH